MTGKARRAARAAGAGLLVGALAMGLAATSTTASADEPPSTPTPTASGSPAAPTAAADDPAANPLVAQANPPFGAAYPIVQETNFAEPVRAVNSEAYSDFSQLEDLERIIRGSYLYPNPYPTNPALAGTLRPEADRRANVVFMSISRMERSKRVGRYLLAAAGQGVQVRFVHGKDSQSASSRSLQKSLNKVKYKGVRTGAFIVCAKSKSMACLSTAKGGIIHTKSLIVASTYTRTGAPAIGAVWFGSANLGGPSGEYTWNNGLTVYNDRKIFAQSYQMFNDLMAKRNVGNDYPAYIARNAGAYGYAGATADGYTGDFATRGIFYSNLSNYSIHASPIAANPVNGRDPIQNALDRIIPGKDCTIRILENRWKYRRLAIAEKLVDLANAGCTISAVAFLDDLKANRALHCQIYIRICRPILDELRQADIKIDIAYAKPHDKVILIDARMGANPLNHEELPPGVAVGTPQAAAWPAGGTHITMVQAGSAALTGSNLVASDEVTTESLDAQVYADYLRHWRGITRSYEYGLYPN